MTATRPEWWIASTGSPDVRPPRVPPTGSWWVDTQRPNGMLDGVVAAEEAARMIRSDSTKTSHGGDK